MADKKKSGKFFTTILIGGAVGSLVAWLFGNKKRRVVIGEKAQEYYETTKGKIDDVLKKPEKKGFFARFLEHLSKGKGKLAILLSFSMLMAFAYPTVEAEQQGEIITKQKTIQRIFNEENPDGKVDLKKIVEEELERPVECDQGLVICQIKEVGFDITIKKKWLKITIADLSPYEFANSVPLLKNSIDKLTKPETVVMQEVLSRRGLLLNLDGSTVKDRGFLGALTWMGLTRLANIKGLHPDDSKYKQKLRDEVNDLLTKMGKDTDYLAEHSLPAKEYMEPKIGDPLYQEWRNYQYFANVAQNGERVDRGNIPLSSNVDVNVDGFVDVKRVTN